MSGDNFETEMNADVPGQVDDQTARADETGPDLHDAPTTRPQPRAPRASDKQIKYPEVPGYEIVELLGRGAYGKVFRAFDQRGQVPCAIKQIDHPENIEAERKSLEAIRELQHHAIIDFRAFFMHEGRLNVVMPLAEDTLGGRLAKEFPAAQGVPAQGLLGYFHDIAQGIDFLHEKGRVHRDIKPNNIVFIGGQVKVADFGTLEELTASKGTVDAEAFGTPGFMAPEVWDNLASTRSDQYSLAVMYASLRMGRPPFQGHTTADYCDAHKHASPDLSLVEHGSERAVIEKALSKERSERFDSCSAFVAALMAATAEQAHAPQVTASGWIQRLLGSWRSLLS